MAVKLHPNAAPSQTHSVLLAVISIGPQLVATPIVAKPDKPAAMETKKSSRFSLFIHATYSRCLKASLDIFLFLLLPESRPRYSQEKLGGVSGETINDASFSKSNPIIISTSCGNAWSTTIALSIVKAFSPI